MSTNFQGSYENSDFIQDVAENDTIPTTGELFTAAHVLHQADETVGLGYAMGLPGLRGTAGPVWGSNTTLAGTAVSSLTTIVFSSDQSSALTVGSLVAGASPTSTGWRRITSKGTGFTMTVDSAFLVNLASETAYRHGTMAERFTTIESSISGAPTSLLHGLTNCKASLSGTTLAVDAQNGSIGATNPIRVSVPLANGTLQWINISSVIQMTLPSGTFTRNSSVMGFTNTDGVSTLTLSGNAVDVILYWYLIYDTNTTYLGVSRSPFHTQMPPNYWHTPSSTGMTAVATDTNTVGTSVTSNTVGTGSKTFTTQAGLAKQFFVDPTRRVRAYSASGSTNFMEGTITAYNNGTGSLTINVDLTGGSGTKTDWNIGPQSPAWSWDDMIISKTGALTDPASPCVSIGPLCYGTIAGSTGRFSAMALTINEFPKWNNRQNPVQYKAADGTASNGNFLHQQYTDSGSSQGSTDTRIQKFTNNPVNNGYVIQYLPAGGASSSGNVGGGEFVVTQPGRYAMFGRVINGSAGGTHGWSKNSVERTSAIDTVANLNTKLSTYRTGSGPDSGAAYAGQFNAGDIIRHHVSPSGTCSTDIMRVEWLGWA